jgi:hypothetical protein
MDHVIHVQPVPALQMPRFPNAQVSGRNREPYDRGREVKSGSPPGSAKPVKLPAGSTFANLQR